MILAASLGSALIDVLASVLALVFSFLAVQLYRAAANKWKFDRSEKTEEVIRLLVRRAVLAAEQMFENRYHHGDKLDNALGKKNFATKAVVSGLKRLGHTVEDTEVSAMIESEIAVLNTAGDWASLAARAGVESTPDNVRKP